MSGKHPWTTDEDAAMAKAVSLVLTFTIHRLCVWHMNQNACKHLAGVVKEYKKFNVDFQHCIYDIEEEDEFLSAWDRMLDKYGLHENEWLQRWFEKREHWALVYGRNTFSVHMSTTQRSESMNNELKRYISVKYDMLTFFYHFERLVADKRFEEVRCDFKATQSTPKLKTEASYMLRQAVTTYTPTIFKMFQEQVLRTLNYDTFLSGGSNETEKVYKVKFHGTQRDHVVRFFLTEEKVSCSCKKFEFAGILCSHCLKVLDINNIKHIPQEYILKRWIIDAKVLDITSKRSQHEDQKVRMSNRYRDLCKMFMKIAARAAESDESYEKAAHCGEHLAQEVEKCLKIRADPELGNSCTTKGLNIDSSRVSKHNEGLTKPKGIKVKEKTTKGSKRPVGGFEKAAGKKKKNMDNTVQVQPQGISTGHLEFFTNQMAAYQLQYNNILDASMPPSIGNTIPHTQELPGFQPNCPVHNTISMSMHPQELARFQPYGSLVGHPTNQMYTYLPQQNYAMDPSLQRTIAASTSSLMTRQNQEFFNQPKPT
uniref:Uncharacterized protein n=1 Tax=Avena sativa TaxID=4498 RepID=A0ACD5XZQ0_AVESA